MFRHCKFLLQYLLVRDASPIQGIDVPIVSHFFQLTQQLFMWLKQQAVDWWKSPGCLSWIVLVGRCSVNAPCQDGRSPLHCAVADIDSCGPIAVRLLSLGAENMVKFYAMDSMDMDYKLQKGGNSVMWFLQPARSWGFVLEQIRSNKTEMA